MGEAERGWLGELTFNRSGEAAGGEDETDRRRCRARCCCEKPIIRLGLTGGRLLAKLFDPA